MGGLWEDFLRELGFAIGADLNFGEVRSVIGGRTIGLSLDSNWMRSLANGI
jgi:hypothetical protein